MQIKKRDLAIAALLALLFVASLQYNQQAYDAITSLQQPWLTPVMIGVTDAVEIWLGLPIIFLILLAWGDRKAFYAALAAVAIDLFVILGLKMMFDKPRPSGGLVAANFSSFPSGHSSRAFSFLSTISEYHARYAIAFIAFAALVAFSRVYLGVHYPRDVTAGALIGFLVSRVVVYGRVGERLHARVSLISARRRSSARKSR